MYCYFACRSAFFDSVRAIQGGTSAIDVKCNYGLQLVIKAKDGSPACVKPETASILIQLGWAQKIILPSSTNAMPTSTSCINTLKSPLYFAKGGNTLILYMPKNSIGTMCVNYFNVAPSEGFVNRTVVLENNQPVDFSIDTINSHGVSPAPDVTISSSRNNVSAGMTSDQVVFSIKTGNYSGIYSGGFSYFQSFVFAVGYNDTSKIIQNFFFTKK